MQHFYERFREYGLQMESLMPVYGLAECSVGLAFPPLGRAMIIDRVQREPFMRFGEAIPAKEDDSRALRFVASGQVLSGHQMRIVDPAGHELPDRQEGQVQFRGPSATSGYFRNPDETARLFDGEWLNSGDLAYMARGDVYITGRSKDVIIRAGRNIYPDELEEAVGNIPGIRKGRVAAFASHAPGADTERLVIMAETREQEPEVLQQLRTRVNVIAADLAEASPDEVVLAPPNTVLKTSSGKIRRAASRELYESNQLGKPQKPVAWQLTRLALASLLPQLRRTRQVLSARLFGLYARLLFWLLVPGVWLSVVLLPRLAWRWAIMRAATRALAWATGTPFRIQGLEHLPPPGQSCVLVSNHASYLDSPALVMASRRQFSFVAKAELKQNLATRVFLRRIRAVFVERFDQQKGIIDARRLVKAAQQGTSLVFFPEGTFARVSGLLPFHMGAFVAAAEAGVPVVPVAIRGTRSILRADTWLPRRGAVTVTFGEAIYPRPDRAGTAESHWATALQLRNATRSFILSQCGEPDLAHERVTI